ncbi:MAG TPA: aminotransferase class III-fold pyridoxal phosphate-dependent enzyme [Streptosporangiaceae bacterium]
MSRHPLLLFSDFNIGRSAEVSIAGGEGIHFLLDDGRRVIDGSDTGAALGHAHPDIVAAIHAAADAPIVNDGWYYRDREEAIIELAAVAFPDDPDLVGAVRFCMSGSEANDLALSLGQALTGRKVLVTRERAYHGGSGLAREVTVQPQWHGGLSSAHGGCQPVPRGTAVRQLPKPNGARIRGAQPDLPPAELRAVAVDALREAACVIIDYSQGGVYHSAEYQDAVAAAARETGALWIADEVVTGFGRTGSWFAFQQGATRPDIITLGKPLAGGACPAGAVVLSQNIAGQLDDKRWQTFSTFRGHPIMIAGLRAHLRVQEREGLAQHAQELDRVFAKGLADIAAQHPSVSRVDGRGTHWTIELTGPDWREWYADVPDAPIAARVAEAALQAGALIGTSGEQTSLFLAPPLIIEEDDVVRLLEALDSGLAVADAEL